LSEDPQFKINFSDKKETKDIKPIIVVENIPNLDNKIKKNASNFLQNKLTLNLIKSESNSNHSNGDENDDNEMASNDYASLNASKVDQKVALPIDNKSADSDESESSDGSDGVEIQLNKLKAKTLETKKNMTKRKKRTKDSEDEEDNNSEFGKITIGSTVKKQTIKQEQKEEQETNEVSADTLKSIEKYTLNDLKKSCQKPSSFINM